MEHEAGLRLGFFLGLFALFAALEAIFPRRPRQSAQGQRWRTNWAIVLLDTGALRLLALALPLLAVGAAQDAAQQGWGLFNQLIWPGWVEFVLAILLLDLCIWAQHLITHKVPLFWRFHRVHHADRDMDVTTAIRFHPVEIAASMTLKIGLCYLIGPSALAVLVFEIVLNGTALFSHSNLRLPPGLETLCRWVLVTPDMHRIHHSDRREEHDSNYGFSLSLWDRLFGTYREAPALGHAEMTVGLQWQNKAPSQLGWSLWLPFQRK